MISDNLKQVRENIEKACGRCGRNPEEVTLVAVSKTKPVSMLMEAYEAGVRDFGENKVQELVEKYDKMPRDVRWHMIGHLQTNKVKQIIDKVCLIHSVDSLHLAQEISRQADKRGLTVDILLEVNVAGEESKFGSDVNSLSDFVKSVVSLPGVRVRGLMTVAPYVVDAEENRSIFADLRKLCVDISPELCEHSLDGKPASGRGLLSMGMTGDYVVAVEEGADLVRVGTGIFGERDYGRAE